MNNRYEFFNIETFLNKMVKYPGCFFILSFLMTGFLFSQPKVVRYTVSGYMRDSVNTEILIGGSVYHASGQAGAATNAYGFYSLRLPAGPVELVYSYMGYAPRKLSFILGRDTIINVSLTGSLSLDEVEITAGRSWNRAQMSMFDIPVKTMKALPAVMGETDIMKALQMLPGIQSGNEGSSGLYVRGGGPDQNQILLDGAPVYNAFHLFGFFSVFNTDAINQAEVYKGGFPARYGGRVSSVVDIRMKEGNNREFHGEGAVGILSSRITFEGPLWKDRTSFIVSGRRTYIDLLAKPITDMGYYFYDFTAKLNHKFSHRDQVYLSAYMGNDHYKVEADHYSVGQGSSVYTYDGENLLKWGNITSVFRWNHIFGPRLFANTSIAYSRFRLDNSSEQWTTITGWDGSGEPETEYNGIRFRSGIEDWTAKTALDYIPSYRHHIRTGGSVTFYVFDPGITGLGGSGRDINNDRIRATEYHAYAEDDIEWSPRLRGNIGLHWSGFDVRGSFYQSLKPRLQASFLATPDLSVKASWSGMVQYIQLLTSSNAGMPTDLWVPVTDRLSPQVSGQVALGISRNFEGQCEIEIEGYYKTMKHVLEYSEGTSFYETDTNWENRTEQGNGRSCGVELFVQKKKGPLTGWVGYTLSWSSRRFDHINGGEWFPYKYDRRHDISIVATRRFGKKLELSGAWVFGSGSCVTLPVASTYAHNPLVGYQAGGSGFSMVYTSRNGFRMPPYHRLDLSLSFIKEKKWGERRWVIGAYNAYHRRNPYYIELGARYPDMEYIQVSLFGIVPSISYQFKF